MHRWLIAAAVFAAVDARADDEPAGPPPPPEPAPVTAPPAAPTPSTPEQPAAVDDVGDQGLGAELGVAIGGRVTPGGLHLGGHYYYQMSADDWFDGAIGFTFGGGGAACFRDRTDAEICQHGVADGGAIEVAAAVRRMLPPNGGVFQSGAQARRWRPFVRLGLGVRYVRFGSDDVSGFAVPLFLGGGVRVAVSGNIAVLAQGEVDVGIATFNHRLGTEPQLGLVVTGGVEFRLR
jgi:hypothetical protein